MAPYFERAEGRRERARRYADMIAAGGTLDSIGKTEGLTRERVRQVLAEYPGVYDRARSVRRANKTEARSARTRVIAENVLALGRETTIAEASAVLGIGVGSINRAIAEHPDLHAISRQRKPFRTRCGRNRKWSDAEIEATLDEFLRVYDPPYSSREFSNFCDWNEGPSLRTVLMRYNAPYWSDLARLKGFEDVGAGTGKPRSTAEMKAAVLRVALETGAAPSSRRYLAERRMDDPSEGTIRHVFGLGSWQNVLRWLYPHTDPPPYYCSGRVQQNGREE